MHFFILKSIANVAFQVKLSFFIMGSVLCSMQHDTLKGLCPGSIPDKIAIKYNPSQELPIVSPYFYVLEQDRELSALPSKGDKRTVPIVIILHP